MGKSIPYLSIGQGKDEVFYNASHHAKRMDNNSPTFKIHRRIFGKALQTEARCTVLSRYSYLKKATLYIVPNG